MRKTFFPACFIACVCSCAFGQSKPEDYNMLKAEADQAAAASAKPSENKAGPEKSSSEFMIDQFIAQIKSSDPHTAVYNLDTITELGGESATRKACLAALESRREPEVALAALQRLAAYHDSECESAAIKTLENPDARVRVQAVRTIGAINGAKAGYALASVYEKDPVMEVRRAAERTLKTLKPYTAPQPAQTAQAPDPAPNEKAVRRPALSIETDTMFTNKGKKKTLTEPGPEQQAETAASEAGQDAGPQE
ncbi:MAG: HEAT repeat domain-containing protein [Elusimicrobiaceae bacterium]